MQKIKNLAWAQLAIIYTRYLIGGTFVFASVIKIKGMRFTSQAGDQHPIASAWHFFETLYQSGLYWKFIGIGQLVAGLLLMTQKYAKLGALVNLPIILNVFIITLSYYFAYTPVVTGLMLLANIILLLWDWDSLKVLINLKPDIIPQFRLENDPVWAITGALLFLFTTIYRILVDDYDVIFWLSICFTIALGGLIIGLGKNRKRKSLV